MKLSASDVNHSSTVNGTDVLFVMKRFTGLISTFPSGDYLYHSDTIFNNNNNWITNNIQMQCFGDVDASYSPLAKSNESLELVYEGVQQVESFGEFDLLVKIKQASVIGAISLGFYYPEEYLEIIGAELVNGSANLVYNAEDGLFRIAWCDLSPLQIEEEEALFNLHMKAKDLSNLTSNILLTLFEESELANPAAQIIEGITLSVPEIQSLETNIFENSSGIGISIQPNPFSISTLITVNLSEKGKVLFNLYDLTGNLVKSIEQIELYPGSNAIGLSAEGLNPGVYMLKIISNINAQVQSEIRKVVISD
jgi:hypothetical protein